MQTNSSFRVHTDVEGDVGRRESDSDFGKCVIINVYQTEARARSHEQTEQRPANCFQKQLLGNE